MAAACQNWRPAAPPGRPIGLRATAHEPLRCPCHLEAAASPPSASSSVRHVVASLGAAGSLLLSVRAASRARCLRKGVLRRAFQDDLGTVVDVCEETGRSAQTGGKAAEQAGGLAAGQKFDRSFVASVVDEYGAAWQAQDAERIAALFHEDGVYIERAFDKTATFRGRGAIRQYWVVQIIGKQANIQFRHVAEAMVFDAERRRATVKWLAEFDNVRLASHGYTAREKKVRFVQVAVLHFSEDGLLTHLEEYLQSTSHNRHRWPSLDASEELIQAMVRMEPDAIRGPGTPERECECGVCGLKFKTRNALFRHLRSGDGSGCGVDQSTGAVILEDRSYDPPSVHRKKSQWHVAYSITYSSEAGEEILAALTNAIQAVFPSTEESRTQMTWAARIKGSRRACINVVGARMPKDADRADDAATAKKVDAALQEAGSAVRVLWCNSVPLTFNAAAGCEHERYELMLPWSALGMPFPSESVDPSEPEAEWAGFQRHLRVFRKRLGSFRTICRDCQDVQESYADQLQHLRADGTLPKDLRVEWCLVSIGIRRGSRAGIVNRLVSAFVGHLLGVIDEERLRAKLCQQIVDKHALPEAPGECIHLVEPNMNWYELGTKCCLYGGSMATDEQKNVLTKRLDELRREVAAMEAASGRLQQWTAGLSEALAG
eukprot:TRINITY_DN31360_c0_g1_i1.p1 TRINITY_DN31360_c0_g1~~TRINITY_DN31360_c0_g1_i1.p1  ORF type:complete len:683 (-),score=101.69 TRINITY_DN31360_c0_g1_i1:522-2501(-)